MTAPHIPSLIAPSHPLVAMQLQIKAANVLCNFTEPCLKAAISSLMPHNDHTAQDKVQGYKLYKKKKYLPIYNQQTTLMCSLPVKMYLLPPI